MKFERTEIQLQEISFKKLNINIKSVLEMESLSQFGITELQEAVLRAKVIQGKTYPVIMEELGTTIAKVKTCYRTARQALIVAKRKRLV